MRYILSDNKDYHSSKLMQSNRNFASFEIFRTQNILYGYFCYVYDLHPHQIHTLKFSGQWHKTET